MGQQVTWLRLGLTNGGHLFVQGKARTMQRLLVVLAAVLLMAPGSLQHGRHLLQPRAPHSDCPGEPTALSCSDTCMSATVGGVHVSHAAQSVALQASSSALAFSNASDYALTSPPISPGSFVGINSQSFVRSLACAPLARSGGAAWTSGRRSRRTTRPARAS